MKFLILIAASCMFVGISGKGSSEESTEATLDSSKGSSKESSEVTLEAITEEASDLFIELTTKVLEVDIDILNNVIYKTYNELVDELESIAFNWKSALIAAQTAALNQIEKTKKSLPKTSNNAITLCSISTTVDFDLYINSEIQTVIQSELTYYKDALSQIQVKSYSLYDSADIYKQYSKEVDNEKATVKSIRNYIDKILKPLMTTYESDARSNGQQFVRLLKDLVAQFKNRIQGKTQFSQTILSTVSVNFNTCVTNSNRL